MKESMVVGLLMTALLFTFSALHRDTAAAEAIPASQMAETAEVNSAPSEAGGLSDEEITLRVKIDGTVQEMTMADYLPGVVRGEMPPTFETEALKAQAAAERTYLCYQLNKGRKAAHPEADVCDNPGCCNAYLSEDDAREKWGDSFEAYDEKVRKAVSETNGQIVLYGGEPIMAVFHSSSGGMTAACGDVWSADLPYLVSVESPENESGVPNYYSVKTMSRDAFRNTFTAVYSEADFSGDWVSDRVEDSSGRVESVTVGGITVSGSEMRQLYGLRSTSFSVDVGDSEVTLHVTGYGHGVGMSQYGANTLAQQGKTWQEILSWYYTDITIGGYTTP